ncbi:hypothetical protein MSSIT_3831 [Methanosarcina siciliae T4/M]|uniref:Uncharacterized protein n=1 Tax=Methanosarcina siciliae T4/M TaxID=1434120 RepID=A0A0E3P991_9EURY|nr:hypothetical protein [Methanosarcina siciliae]AKB30550.1 hypothetical protein MSSIT_3831 [Methanosarcina siciliae T4/M]
MIPLNAEKKERMEKARAYKKVRDQNKKVTAISLSILAVGLLLMTLNITILGVGIGYYLVVAGVTIFFVTSISGLFAAGSLRKQR